MYRVHTAFWKECKAGELIAPPDEVLEFEADSHKAAKVFATRNAKRFKLASVSGVTLFYRPDQFHKWSYVASKCGATGAWENA